MDDWHRQTNRAARAAERQWEGCGIGGFAYTQTTIDQPRTVQWTIREITSAKELQAEGRTMRHCVGSYSVSCARGNISIWTVQARYAELDDCRSVLTVALTRDRRVSEVRGRFNTLPGRRPPGVTRLDNIESELLVRSPKIVRRWAAAEGLLVPESI